MNQPFTEKNRRILIVDDNRAIHDDFRKILSFSTAADAALEKAEAELFGQTPNDVQQIRYEIDSAYQGEEGIALAQKALEEQRPYAMAFVDIRMPPGLDGVETARKIWAIDPDIQIVLCTAYADYSWDEMFQKIGDSDALVILKKPFDTVEALQLAHALTEKWQLHQQSRQRMKELESRVSERTHELRQTNHALQNQIAEHQRTTDELRWKTAFLEAQVNSSIDGILVVNEKGNVTLQNQRFVDLLKVPPHIIDEKSDNNRVQWVANLTKNPGQFIEKVHSLYSQRDEVSQDEIEFTDGTVLERYSAPVLGNDGKYYGRIWTFRDITQRKRFEAQLLQSQRMETVGKLAGGVAHEFNSIMTAIIGRSELLLNDLPAKSPPVENAVEIRKAAGRAAALTRQLLAFGRKQILQPEILNLNHVVAEMKNTLSHLMGEKVTVNVIPGADLKLVKADASQIEQVIVNMAINAADAMPNGGTLAIETANVALDEHAGNFNELKAGNYVILTIADTGIGMSNEVKTRVFEPFFTTKGVGKGTGLGLATCHGIIKQSGGHITVQSKPGHGATFKVYLPQIEQKVETADSCRAAGAPGGTETILLVEEDPALRMMAATLLKRLGYVVLPAGNGIEALNLASQQNGGGIDLLFTDIAASQMGRELSDGVRSLFPRIKTLFVSIYPEDTVARQVGTGQLQKPFTPSALAHKVREILDGENEQR